MTNLEKLLHRVRHVPHMSSSKSLTAVLEHVDSFLKDEWDLIDVIEMTIDDVDEVSCAANVGSGTMRALNHNSRKDFLDSVTKAFHNYRGAGGKSLNDFLTSQQFQLNDEELQQLKQKV